MQRRLRISPALVAALLGACGDDDTLQVPMGEGGVPHLDGAPPDAGPFDAGPVGELAALRVIPGRGPFYGGNVVVVRGSGFAADARVRFGAIEVAATDTRVLDPNRVEVRVPAAAAGVVDVAVTTTRPADDDAPAAPATVTIAGGYVYEAFGLTPEEGPPTGGTRVTVRAEAATFDASTRVLFDDAECTSIAVVSPNEVTCRTPAHALGDVDVHVEATSTATLSDAFRYENPFRALGGLGGGPIDGTITVRAQSEGGEPLEGAVVFLGDDFSDPAAMAKVRTGPDGTAVFAEDGLVGPATIYVAHPCYHTLAFSGFDAAYVTAQMRLAFIAESCTGGGQGGPGPSNPTADVAGEVVFFDGEEFETPTFEFTDVPEPTGDERRLAYVYVVTARDTLNGDGTSTEVSAAITVDEDTERGERGYRFAFDDVAAGRAYSVVALAGLASESTGSFEPYLVGLSTPFVLAPGPRREGVEVTMTTHMTDGRTLSATAPNDVPTLLYGANDFFGGEPTTSDELVGATAFVRYAKPGFPAGFPLFGNDDWSAETSQVVFAPAGDATLTKQPANEGVFTGFTQELHVIVYGLAGSVEDVGNWYDEPHTRTTVRAPLGDAPVVADDFLAIPSFTAPAAPGDAVGADRRIRWEADATTEASFQRMWANESTDGFSIGLYFYSSPSVRSLVIPDFSSEPDLPQYGPGTYYVRVARLDVPAVDYDELDIRYVDGLPVTRSAVNVTQAQIGGAR